MKILTIFANRPWFVTLVVAAFSICASASAGRAMSQTWRFQRKPRSSSLRSREMMPLILPEPMVIEKIVNMERLADFQLILKHRSIPIPMIIAQ